jgi:hypothetical protein
VSDEIVAYLMLPSLFWGSLLSPCMGGRYGRGNLYFQCVFFDPLPVSRSCEIEREEDLLELFKIESQLSILKRNMYLKVRAIARTSVAPPPPFLRMFWSLAAFSPCSPLACKDACSRKSLPG